MPRTFKYRGELVSLTALMVCTFSSIGGFIFGYDIGYLAGCLEMPYFQAAYGTSYPDGTAHASRQAITTSILSVGSFTGALLGVPIADYVGRRLSILTSAVVFIIGVVVQVAPVRIWGGLLAGRFIAGMGVGALSALVPLYLGEVSPKALRGGFTSLYQVSITLGILLAYILTYATHRIPSDASYQIPIAIQCLWGLILAVGCPFLPASPRESVLKGDLDASRKTVASMHGVALHHPLVEYTVREIESKLEEEKASGSGYLDCFNFKNDIQTGKRTLIGMTVQAFQQLTGANFIFYYGTTVFTTLSIDSYVSQIIFGAISSVSTLLGLFCLDYFGRRRTMVTGAIVMGLAYLMYAVLGAYALYPNNDTSAEPRTSVGGVIVFFICIFSLGYGGSWGPGGWVNTGEIAPLRTKAKQLSFVAASNWTFNTLISALSPIITASIGAKYGFVFLVTNFMAAAFIYFCVPEMSGLSLEEINLLFQERVSPRKSFKWNKEQRAKKHSYDGETEITDVNPDVEVANLKTAEKPKAPAPPQHLESGDSGATRV